MTFDYSGMVSTANSLIDRFGRDLTLRTYVNSGTAYEPTRTATDTTVKGVVLDFTNEELERSKLLNRNRDIHVATQEKKAILKSTSTVSRDDDVIDGAVTYSVTSVTTINPGDTVVYYEAYLRV